MTFQVKVAERAIAFPCEGTETVLEAAERNGFSIPYSCRKGVCNTCEAGLLSGEADLGRKGVVSGPDPAVLLCRAKPRSDLEIVPRRIEVRDPVARKTFTVNVLRLMRPTCDVAVLQLRLPAGNRVKFKAGQYLQILMADGDRRNFSMANPPHENDGVQLHIRHVPGGRFSEGVLSELEAGSKLRIELPFGEFFLRDGSKKPAILLATGTGFSPIKSMVEYALKRGSKRSMALYWGARRREDIYMADLPQKWIARAPWFTFVPVLSEQESWDGRGGLVHRAVLEDHPDLSGYEVYACGNPFMIEAAQKEFAQQAGLPIGEFFSDAFVPSGDAEPPPGLVPGRP
jgi:NAD(P)H-flavin reductase/ferredoxin